MNAPRPQVCVGAVITWADKVLLIQRGRSPGIGAWSIPGGRVEFGETLSAAVRREVFEETHLNVEAFQYLGHVERISAEWHFVIHDYICEVDTLEAGNLRADDDAMDARWVPLGEVAYWPGLVPGVAEFLVEHGVVRL